MPHATDQISTDSPTMADPTASLDPATLQAAYQQHLPAALALPADAVVPLRADPALMYANVRRGVATIVALEGELRPHLPQVAFDRFAALPGLAAALVFAHGQVAVAAEPSSQVAPLAAQVRSHRKRLLGTARVLADLGLLPAAEVAEIAKGRGLFDSAADVTALVPLYQRHWAQVATKVPFTAEELTTAAEAATALTRALRPAGRLGDLPATELARRIDLRDRFHALLIDGYREVRRVAAYRWLDEAEDHVPSLWQRRL